MGHHHHRLSNVERSEPATLVPQAADPIECAYRNSSDRMVIVRCSGPDAYYLERVVFPFELLSFRCPPQSALEIWTHGLGGPELLEVIRADQLRLESPAADTAASPAEIPWWMQAS